MRHPIRTTVAALAVAFSLLAALVVGASPASAAAPDAPTDVEAVGQPLQATVSWTAPEDSGGEAIDGYEVRDADTDEVLVTTSYLVTEVAVIGLEPGTWSFTVTAFNADGTSEASAPSGDVEVTAADETFSDVVEGQPFYAEINWSVVLDIARGYEDGEFKPANAVSRQAMAAFLYRFAGEPEYEPPAEPTFPDVPTDHEFYKEIEWLAEEEIATGYDDGDFEPTNAVSRQAMAAFLYRFAGEPPFEAPLEPTFPDVPPGHDFYDEIEWLTLWNIATGYDDGEFKPNNAVSRQAMVAFLYRYTLEYPPVAPPLAI